jgi:hypothetical protein
MLFADSDVDEIVAARDNLEKHARADYFAYFSELAQEYYWNLISENRPKILEAMMSEAIKRPFLSTIQVPLHTVWTYKALTPYDREVRRIYENQHYNTGAWFESLAGVHRANIYAIFVHSDFKEKMDARLGRGMFLSMTSNHVRTSDGGVKEFEVVLWVNLALSKR